MTYSIYLRRNDGAQRLEHQTRTADPIAAVAAFRALLARRDLDGQPAAAVLRDQTSAWTILYSRFDTPEQRLLPDDHWVLHDLDDDPDINTRRIVAARPVAGTGDLPDPLPRLVKAYRARLGVTQDGLAKRWGVSKAWVMKTERGGAGAAAGPLRDLLGQLLA